jgi:cell wall-associated NlpC family hydrolase
VADIVAQLPLPLWEEIKPTFAAAFPNEAVVAIHGEKWKQLANVSSNPTAGFQLRAVDTVALCDKPPTLLLHSHPHGSAEPSDLDTIQQLKTGYDWGIVSVSGNPQGQVYDVAYPECWGDGIAIAPLLGRAYLWGIRDCMTLARDWYKLNGVQVPNLPRARNPELYPATDWMHNQFGEAPAKLAFKQVERHKRERGDTALMQFRASTYNHMAVYLGEGKYLHQLRDALSCEWIPHDEERLIERMNVTYWRPPTLPTG